MKTIINDADIQYFLNTNLSHEETLSFYNENICDTLMYNHPTNIKNVTNKLINNIQSYAKINCNLYSESIHSMYSRHQLLNQDEWISKSISKDRIKSQHTSGSTTGEPFRYYCDNQWYESISRKSEFDTILQEYGLINKPLNILNLFKHSYNPSIDTNNFTTRLYNSPYKFHSYGASDTQTHFVNWINYMEDPDTWHNQLLNLFRTNFFDIIFISGPVLNILCKYLVKHNFTRCFGYLLSHTTEFPRTADFEFIKKNGNVVHYCDHMRCWDGGASFFTCKYGTYHLNDHLSWVSQDRDNKMISTDYFNFVSPFINYWNGDLCEIKEDYYLCKCQRYYRPFKMLENRPFALKGPVKLTAIKKQISQLEFKNKINQVQFDGLNVNIYLSEPVGENGVNIISSILKDYKVKFYE